MAVNKKHFLLLISSFIMFLIVSSGPSLGASQSVSGRWDLVVGHGNKAYPSWLEITAKDGQLSGRFVGQSGSARPIKKLAFENGHLAFSLPVQYERSRTDMSFDATLSASGDQLTGTTKSEEGAELTWVGVRAPALPKPKHVKWGAPIELFNGKDLSGWKARDPKGPNGWKAVDHVMENDMPSGDILTERKFKDFKLHIEFNCPSKSNSGVYLRGRYEVQIVDSYGQPPESHRLGGLYGFIDPTENAGKPGGEWQTYDITLLGRYVTVVLNGKTIIDDKEIPGITGGALHSREAEPGPLLLQGDHGKVLFRNIVLTPAVE
jgi:3-keto-disaccharide hydrolase